MGLFGEDNLSTHFTIGDEVIATADDTTKMLTVRIKGAVAKTMPTFDGQGQQSDGQRHLHHW